MIKYTYIHTCIHTYIHTYIHHLLLQCTVNINSGGSARHHLYGGATRSLDTYTSRPSTTSILPHAYHYSPSPSLPLFPSPL